MNRFYNSINNELRGQQPFNILLFENGNTIPANDASLNLANEWCNGYLEGVDLDEFWSADDAAIESLYPFAILSGQATLSDKGEQSIENNTKQKIKILH